MMMMPLGPQLMRELLRSLESRVGWLRDRLVNAVAGYDKVSLRR